MKIRAKLTIRYTLVTAAVVSGLVVTILLFAGRTREKEFFRTLRSEAITKANLYLSDHADAEIMQSIYRNNREFINEVEVAVYDTDFGLIYHDATDIDLVKETPEMFRKILSGELSEFYEQEYQVVGLIYDYEGKNYIVTAAAYDGQGYAKQKALATLLISLWLVGMVLVALVGYLLARSALSPVAQIVDDFESITESNLDKRLEVQNPADELGELSETFNRMLDRLETSFDNQKMFVSNVSHELRTPMAALIAELEVILLRERTSNEYRNAIECALQDARKIERLSSGLLDLARANYDPNEISLREVRLDELLLDARELVIKANKDYHVELLFEQNLEDERLITVRGNEYLLKTALVNLIENNCKFSDDHTSYISISYFGDNSLLRFSDTGVGMAKEEAENMFAPFYRGVNSGGTAGHGIGMALVRKIIQLHKGTIQVHSHIGEGTVFICEIPHL